MGPLLWHLSCGLPGVFPSVYFRENVIPLCPGNSFLSNEPFPDNRFKSATTFITTAATLITKADAQ